MKLLTLNTHSWLEKQSNVKFNTLVEAILENKFDIIAFQEVNQKIDSKTLDKKILDELNFVTNSSEPVIKEDNFALKIVEELRLRGMNYYWSWVPNHIGYEIYDEGLAVLSRENIIDTDEFYISLSKDHKNYKTRRVLGIKTINNETPNWFFSVHMGWWNDQEDPFSKQWDKITEGLSKHEGSNIYLMGDFNSPAHIKNEGYNYIRNDKNFYDTYSLAEVKDSGNTVIKEIDGWRDDDVSAMRIDYIFKNNSEKVKSSKVIFNGQNYDVVSDHFGIFVED